VPLSWPKPQSYQNSLAWRGSGDYLYYGTPGLPDQRVPGRIGYEAPVRRVRRSDEKGPRMGHWTSGSFKRLTVFRLVRILENV
jgi:hypothetical protein